ncbi:YegS/Rv2252/BmrU family lipid kinase [Chamaesiphon sp. OTE_75_metabat_556]|uniref:YegS/Rv2252/BmrU family lipid kinase n=1 Tax=Chamaesiphon sp. OTE_75_metabat_556 TaxID=2964692 RepID=UPI00286CF7D4|nr:YegS/Rv2252/BmrU family lipid kinase [Chamaesiphon sp. OTE_75_metabat_556]
MKPQASLIFNPIAGQGDPEQDLALIKSLLSESLDLDIIVTTAECEPGELAKAAIDRGAGLIIASGGDGTLSAVAAALMGTSIPLGVISRGTANAFANALDLPTTIPEACAAILTDHTKVVDVARCNGLPMVLLAGIGFEAETVNLADRDAKKRMGVMAYVLAGLSQLRNLEQFEAHIETEDKIITVSAAAITIANAAPATSILAQGAAEVVFDDGLLDLTIIAPKTALGAIATSYDHLSTTLRGEASQRQDVGFLRAKHFKVTTTPPQKVVLDGEIIGTTPLDIECIPNGLTIFAPSTEEPQLTEKLEGLPNLTIEVK